MISYFYLFFPTIFCSEPPPLPLPIFCLIPLVCPLLSSCSHSPPPHHATLSCDLTFSLILPLVALFLSRISSHFSFFILLLLFFLFRSLSLLHSRFLSLGDFSISHSSSSLISLPLSLSLSLSLSNLISCVTTSLSRSLSNRFPTSLPFICYVFLSLSLPPAILLLTTISSFSCSDLTLTNPVFSSLVLPKFSLPLL